MGDFPVTRSTLPETSGEPSAWYSRTGRPALILPHGARGRGLRTAQISDSRPARLEKRVEETRWRGRRRHPGRRPPTTFPAVERSVSRPSATVLLHGAAPSWCWTKPPADSTLNARRRLLGLLLGSLLIRESLPAHDLAMVLDLCEWTIVLPQGLVKADGPTRRYSFDDRHLANAG